GGEEQDKKMSAASRLQADGHVARLAQDREDKRELEAKALEDEQEIGNEPRCSICTEELEQEVPDKIAELGCKHQFHMSCINHWLPMNNTCPNCRAEQAGAPKSVILEKYYTPEQERKRHGDFDYFMRG